MKILRIISAALLLALVSTLTQASYQPPCGSPGDLQYNNSELCGGANLTYGTDGSGNPQLTSGTGTLTISGGLNATNATISGSLDVDTINGVSDGQSYLDYSDSNGNLSLGDINGAYSSVYLTIDQGSGSFNFTHGPINAPGILDKNGSLGTGVQFLGGDGSGALLWKTPTGFANPMTTLGDTIYGGASGVATRLAGQTSATKEYLSQTGTGSASAAPAWAQVAFADISGNAAVNQGGTGQTSYTNGQLLIGNTTGNTLTKATLTQGTGISITNSTGSITINTTGVATLAGGASAAAPQIFSGWDKFNNVIVAPGLAYSVGNQDEYIGASSAGNVTIGDVGGNLNGIIIAVSTTNGITTQYNSVNINTLMDVAGTGNMIAKNNMSAPTLTSTVATGTAPFTVTSTTNVANLNASSLNGATFANPGAIGATPGTGNFTTLTDTGEIITSAAANCLSVGLNGSTNPGLNVDCSTASTAVGFNIKGGAAGGGAILSLISSGTNENGNITLAKGTGTGTIQASTLNLNGSGGTIGLQVQGTNKYQIVVGSSAHNHSWSSAAATAGSATRYTFNIGADTGLATTAETTAAYFNFGVIRTHAAGTIPLQRDVRVTASTHAFASASALTTADAFEIDGPPICGTNATCTTVNGIAVPTEALTNTTTGYAANFAAPTGATNNYAANFAGDVTFTGSAPTVSSCGSGSIVTGSTDHKGQISGISVATACTITFSQALAAAPACTFSTNAAIVPTISTISTTAVTTTMTALTGTLYYICF